MPAFSIGCHTTTATESARTEVVVEAKGENTAALGTAHGCRAVLHLARLLTEGKGGSSAQLVALAKLVHTTLTGILVLLGVHAQIVLGEAAGTMGLEEAAIATVENVDLWEGELGIAEHILLAVFLTNSLGPGQTIRIDEQKRETT